MILPVDYTELEWQERREVRLKYIELQNGLCHHCKTSLSSEPHSDIIALKINKALFPETFFNYQIHLHHDHDTGMTIGAVHAKCNAVLWQYHGE